MPFGNEVLYFITFGVTQGFCAIYHNCIKPVLAGQPLGHCEWPAPQYIIHTKYVFPQDSSRGKFFV